MAMRDSKYNITQFDCSQTEQVPISLVPKSSESVSEARRSKPGISGTYNLIDRGENFGEFLESIGMSRSYLAYLKDMEEKLTVIEETTTNPNWTMILATSK